MSFYVKPLPEPKEWSERFWNGCKKHELLVQRCSDCGEMIMYPKKYCPSCLSDNLGWVKASGKGKIYSFSVVYNNPPSPFKEDLPFVVAVVELNEGVRICTNIVESDLNSLECEALVQVCYRDVTPDITLPYFKLVKQ